MKPRSLEHLTEIEEMSTEAERPIVVHDRVPSVSYDAQPDVDAKFLQEIKDSLSDTANDIVADLIWAYMGVIEDINLEDTPNNREAYKQAHAAFCKIVNKVQEQIEAGLFIEKGGEA